MMQTEIKTEQFKTVNKKPKKNKSINLISNKTQSFVEVFILDLFMKNSSKFNS